MFQPTLKTLEAIREVRNMLPPDKHGAFDDAVSALVIEARAHARQEMFEELRKTWSDAFSEMLRKV